ITGEPAACASPVTKPAPRPGSSETRPVNKLASVQPSLNNLLNTQLRQRLSRLPWYPSDKLRTQVRLLHLYTCIPDTKKLSLGLSGTKCFFVVSEAGKPSKQAISDRMVIC